MGKPWKVWLAFALCLAVVFAAMGWVSVTLLRLDLAEIEGRRQAAIEENVRLALWRMDSMLGQITARENARPYFSYQPFYPAGRAYTKMFAEIRQGEILVPSPLLTENTPFIKLHFQFAPDGSMSSPQVPAGNMRDLAESRFVDHVRIDNAGKIMKALEKILNRDSLLARLKSGEKEFFQTRRGSPVSLPEKSRDSQQLKSLNEYGQRWGSNKENTQQSQSVILSMKQDSVDADEHVLLPIWIGDELVLARAVTVDGVKYLQGCWFEWGELKKNLLDKTRDLLPDARLIPVAGKNAAEGPRMLASLPIRLVYDAIPNDSFDATSPVKITLAVAWGCVLLGGVAVAALLFGAMSLSERRGAFVSAVTHELRTPLTTFRMYSEMLKEGMVPDEEKRISYLKRLHAEADRLSHLVENVLTYARLERGRADRRAAVLKIDDVIERVKDQLSRRAEEAGMEFAVATDGESASTYVTADTSAVERILFNIVDNACKYAADADDKTIRISSKVAGNFALLRVSDNGPGISVKDRRYLFKPFRKSARDAAGTAPGVGLGLALSRRLARDMNGNLFLDENVDKGACFVLSLPLAPAAENRLTQPR